MIRGLLNCEGCVRRRKAYQAWLAKLKYKGNDIMNKLDKRTTAALGSIIKESGVSEGAVLKVIDALKNTDAVAVTVLLDLGKESEPESESKAKTGKVAKAPAGQLDDQPNGLSG